ncbi:MAG TPA: hypothetical protein GX699_02790, partial [Firmicutes bacterium]|nr:hypothetical protein [Bacillota bacterium]
MGLGTRLQETFAKLPDLARSSRWQRIALTLLFYLFILALLYLSLLPHRVDLTLGNPSPRRIVAEWEAVDHYETERQREQAARAVAESYDYDPTVLSRAEERIGVFFRQVRAIRALELEQEIKAARLMAEAEIELTEPLAVSLLESRVTDLEDMQVQLLAVLQAILQQGVKPAGVETARRQAAQEISFLIFDQDQKRVMVRLAEAVIEANMIYNAEATAQAQQAAREAVEPVRILEGTVIIQEREIVTKRHLEQLEALGLLRGTSGYPMFFGLALLLLVVFLVAGLYLYIFQRELYHDPKRLLLLGLITTITLILSIAANYFSGYLLPVGMGVILIAVLLNGGLAVLMSIVFAVIAALLTGNDFRFMLIALVGGLVAAYSVGQLQRRSD